MKYSGRGSVSRFWSRTSATTPTTRAHAFVSLFPATRMRLPRGSSPGKYFRWSASLISATGSEVARSSDVKNRPRTSRIPTVSK